MRYNDFSSYSRKPLPEAWRVRSRPHSCNNLTDSQGIRDDQLSELTGIPDCVFVHASGFIGGNKTKEGAMAMAIKAFEM